MRTYLLAAVAAAAIATPAVAQDVTTSGPYVGIEGGVLFPQKTDTDIILTDGTTTVTRTDAFRLGYDTGYDIDAIAGYDLGMFRLEGELGYKRAGLNSIDLDPALIDEYNDATGDTLTASDFDADGNVTVMSAMLNGLVDFNIGSLGVYAGGGVGYADVKFDTDGGSDSDNDNGWAYQLIAGVRAAVTSNLDLGLKYRYFQTETMDFDADYDTVSAGLHGKFRSHSLLASLIYNFGAPAPAAYVPEVAPPPPAPVAPATQTCPDGSVILATDACPLPPPPPPPAAPPVGERG